MYMLNYMMYLLLLDNVGYKLMAISLKQVERVLLRQFHHSREYVTGTLCLTDRHLIFIEPTGMQETWVRETDYEFHLKRCTNQSFIEYPSHPQKLKEHLAEKSVGCQGC